jgi:hypothetical protein
MAPRSKDARIRLLEPLATDFAAFRAALGMGVTEIGVIRDAVRAFIESRIAADDELSQRYEAERQRLTAQQHHPRPISGLFPARDRD